MGRHDVEGLGGGVQKKDAAALHFETGRQYLHGFLQVFTQVEGGRKDTADLENGMKFLIFSHPCFHRNPPADRFVALTVVIGNGRGFCKARTVLPKMVRIVQYIEFINEIQIIPAKII